MYTLQIGTYDPLPSYKDGVKEVRMKVDRVKYWLSVGAQPSDVVGFLLWKSGLMPAPPITPQTKKRIPRQQREFSTLARAQESHDLTVGRDSDQWTMTETTTAQHRRNATDAMQTDTYRVRLAGTYFTLRNVFQPRQQQTLQRM